MTITKAIEGAIEGGWPGKKVVEWDILRQAHSIIDMTYEDGTRAESTVASMLLDPKFWQALGKTMGWNTDRCLWFEPRSNEPVICSQCAMHRMINSLCDGNSIEEYIKTL